MELLEVTHLGIGGVAYGGFAPHILHLKSYSDLFGVHLCGFNGCSWEELRYKEFCGGKG